MATKVFLKWFGTNGENGLTTGREYEFVEWHVVNDSGTTLYTSGLEPHWQRIERQTFEANGFQWFAHEPGDAIPCDGDSVIHVICKWEAEKGEGHDVTDKAKHFWFSQRGSHDDIIGWRFAGSAQTSGAETQTSGANLRTCDDETPDRFPDFAWLEFLKLAAPDVAAVEDTSLPPRIRRIVNEKEDAQAAKQQLAKDAQDKALQERADQLADAGKAMDRVNQDHGHRLGWMA